MRAAKVLALLLAVSVAHLVHVDADDFEDTDDGVTVEVEKVSFMFFFLLCANKEGKPQKISEAYSYIELVMNVIVGAGGGIAWRKDSLRKSQSRSIEISLCRSFR